MQKPNPCVAPAPSLEYGLVKAAAPGRIEVETSFGAIPAVRAVSCLVEPALGDKVLLSVDMSGAAYVLSVLESASPVTLALEGDARLEVRGGSLSVAADRDIDLSCAGGLAATSGEVTLRAARADATVERVHIVGRALASQFKRIRCVAGSMDQLFRRFILHARESSRFVQEHDEVQAGSRRVLVDDLCALHARNHSMLAEEQVVINADQIHMG